MQLTRWLTMNELLFVTFWNQLSCSMSLFLIFHDVWMREMRKYQVLRITTVTFCFIDFYLLVFVQTYRKMCTSLLLSFVVFLWPVHKDDKSKSFGPVASSYHYHTLQIGKNIFTRFFQCNGTSCCSLTVWSKGHWCSWLQLDVSHWEKPMHANAIHLK